MDFFNKANQTLVAFPDLHTDGFAYRQGGHDAWNLDKVEKLCEFIRHNWYQPESRSKTFYRGSYSLKHEVEAMNWTTSTDKYVSNGELILAMLILRYEPKNLNLNSLNCCFYVKTDNFFKEGEYEARTHWEPRMSQLQYDQAVEWETKWKAEDEWWNQKETYRVGYETKKARINPRAVPPTRGLLVPV